MPTLTELGVSVLRILGDEDQTFWTEGADDYLIEGIQFISEMVVPDALHALVSSQIYTGNGTVFAFARPSDELLPLRIEVEESTGERSQWVFTHRDQIIAKRHDEQDLTQDSSSQRLWTWGQALSVISTGGLVVTSAAYQNAYELYPIPESSREIVLTYIAQPSESGSMTASNLLLKAVKEYAISVMASKRSRDLDLSDRYEKKYRQTILDVNNRYRYAYGMSRAIVDRIRVTS